MADTKTKSILDIVRETIAEPKTAEVDGQKVENRSISELKQAAELLSQSTRTGDPLGSVHIARAKGNSAV